MNKTTPTRANVVVLKQMLNLIPLGLINRHARETGLDAKARSFSGLHGAAGLCDVALHGASVGMGTQLHEALRGDALGVVGAAGPVGPAQILWDSIGPSSHSYVK